MSTTKRTLLRCLSPVLAAMAVLLLSTEASVAGPASSNPPHKLAPKSPRSAKPIVKPVVVPKSKMTISLNHRLRRGNLVVLLDGTPIFNEEFVKEALAISQTTIWDPVEAPAGKHRLSAQVKGNNGRTYLSEPYDLTLSRTTGVEVRIRMKGDKLTIDPVS